MILEKSLLLIPNYPIHCHDPSTLNSFLTKSFNLVMKILQIQAPVFKS